MTKESETFPADADDTAPATAPRRLISARMLLPLLAVVSVAVASGLYFGLYRVDLRTDDDVAHAVLDAATSGSTALLSYSPDTIDEDIAAATSHLTGDFLAYYTEFTDQVVVPAAREKSVDTTASVVRAAVSDLREDAATVLVYINQTTTSADKPDPTATSSSVLVSLSHVDGRWLISAFDPV
ncbi:MAG: twin-arginine translocation pathway signal [Rhodococcus sp. (in: high G+C Gram-positive bacteria)]|uniref:twin-arginine translocation pathway signal n=1 Tax=Rhodococcus sp. TaxID=1831 RepID=UPI003BB63B28